MKISTLPLALLPVVLLTVADAGAKSPDEGAAQSVAAATERLATARANLSKASLLIEKDPPSDADLDAAQAAVTALKDAIDAGAEHEAKDLDFARAVLAARKELRTGREFVEQRRASIQLHARRQELDRGLAEFSERVRRVEAKDASQKEFDEARAASAIFRKSVDEARPLAKHDPKFGSYIADLDAILARHEKAIDDRWTLRSVEKHRVVVEESRQALAASMAALGKGGGEGQFEAVERASTQLSKRLDEGKVLEAKDKTYRADADRARSELAQSKKRVDELWSQMGLERMKAEIEPAYRELNTARQGLRGKRPSPDQLAEARTAAIVVRKLVEKLQPGASRNPGLAEYLSEVKKTLAEVEVEIQRRNLDGARADLAQALRNVEGRAPTDEHFEEAKTALMILQKTLETVHTRDPEMVKPVGDARKQVQEARTTLVKRRLEVDVQRQRAKVEEARRKAVALIGQLHKVTGNDGLKEAEEAVKALSAVLDEGAPLIKKDREYAVYNREMKERIGDLNEKIGDRRVALAAGDARGGVSEAMATAKSKLEAAKQPTATDSDIDAASKSVLALNQTLDARSSVEKQDKGYATYAAKARQELDRLQAGLEFAKQARTLRRNTAEALAAGTAAAETAPARRELRAQKEQYDKAIALFQSCESAGTSMIEENRALANAPMIVDGRPGNAKEVIALCKQQTESAQRNLKQVIALIRFEEGPKRSFEAGKGLLAQAKKSEALTQFDECISTGMILQHRNPELKDLKFEVAGSSMTLGEVLQQCVNARKPLRAAAK